MKKTLLLLLLACSSLLLAQPVSVGSGSYTLSLPVGATILPNNPAPGTSHYQRVDNVDRTGAMPRVVPGFSQPIATNEWWSSAIWSYEMPNSQWYPDWIIAPYSFVMHPHPFVVAATRYGLNITSEDNPVTSTFNYHNYRENHLWVGLDGMDVPASTGTRIKSYGDWSVTMQWDDGAGRVLEATSGHGFPYVYFKKTGNSAPTLRYVAGVPTPYATVSNANIEARGVTILGKNYGIFCPPGTTFGSSYILNQSEADMVAPNSVPRDAQKIGLPVGQNYFSIALLPDNSKATLEYYATFAFAFVTDTKVEWAYDECKSEVTNTFTFKTEPQGASTESKTLMAMYRHQWLHTTAAATPYTYPKTARGEMKVFEGSSFTNTHTNHGFLHSLPDYGTYNKASIAAYVKQEVAKGKNFFFYADNASLAIYGAGVALQKVSDLAELANMVGDYTSRDTFLSWSKNYLQRWFTAGKGVAPNDDQFFYDANWQSLIGMPSAFESDRQLNDHHFGYGYFVKAAAMVAKFEPNNTWETQWGPMVEMLIKDVANWDRNNAQFPFLRNFDPYAGHSWASGHANFTAGNNQESSSEAINFASGVALWGTETDNKTLRDLGAFLYTTEIEAARQYWFDEDNATLPNTWGHNRIGIQWGWGADYQTWFGSATWPGVQAEYVHGISFLPISGSSLYLGLNQANAAANFNEITTYSGPLKTDFKDIVWCFQALFDAAAAKSTFTANESTYIPQTGETKAHTMHWIGALDKLGTVDATITADMPTYAVFNKNGCKNYVVYNPKGAFAKAKVTFSDGRCFLLPKQDTMYVFNKCPDPKKPDSIYVTCPNNPVKLVAKDTLCGSNFQWDRNGTNIGGATKISYLAALAGEYHVSYKISDCLVKNDTFKVELKDTISTTNIKKVCNALGTAYTLSFDISGGDAASYSVKVNGAAAGGPGQLNGSNFTSASIPSGKSYFFLVSDKNNCAIDTISGMQSCICATQAGTMKQPSLKICGDTAIARAMHNNDEVLDANDTLIYYLHSGSGSTLGTVYGSANTPSFSYNNTLAYGTTYYISAVAGNKNNSGGIDLSDPCLSVATGTVTVFWPLPSAQLGADTALCQGSSITLDAGSSVNYLWSTAESTKTISVSAAGKYSVRLTDANGCINSDTIVVKSTQAPSTPTFSETCNGTSDYTVSFTISGGDSLSYSVLMNAGSAGGPGTLNNKTFTSAPIPSGTPYSFIVKDKFSCTPNTVSGTKNCNCITNAGNMSLATVSVCENTTAVVATTSASQLDGTDILRYYLHSNNGTTLGTVFASNTAPSFNFTAPMAYGVTYYISAVVGNDNGSGTIDLNDPCLSVSKGTPVVFSALPSASFAGNDSTVCGNSAMLAANLPLYGTGIWTLSAGTGNFSNITSPNSSVNGISTGSNTFTWTIISGTCPPNSSNVIIKSYALPSASSAGKAQQICTNESILSANAPITGTGSWTSSATIDDNFSATPKVSALQIGNNTFTWTISNGVCPPSVSSVIVKVDAQPINDNIFTAKEVCGTSSTITATTPSVGVGTWSISSGSATIEDVNSNNTTLNSLQQGDNEVLWTVSNGTCPSVSKILHISSKPLPALNIGKDSTLCDGDHVLLTAASATAPYVCTWQDNNTGPQYLATKPGEYFVSLKAADCPAVNDTIVFDNNCPYHFYLPNAFTPNGDNKNEIFNANAYNILSFQMDIFDRWGENIYSTNDLESGWNGKSRWGNDAQIDVYVYKINFTVQSQNDKTLYKSLIGRVSLIR